MGSCCGNCGSCSGCAKELVLSSVEIDFLRRLGEVAFLPVARQIGDLTPIYPEGDGPENMSLILEVLEKKGLISLDYDKPLAGFAGYGDYPIKGSMALTQRGQQVLELIEYQGVQAE
ncbi:MAG: hypothetical protein Q4F81_00320 [Eubacteriales bacterium]|nr:hypothetical protein [Eubacteriales bacterium]